MNRKAEIVLKPRLTDEDFYKLDRINNSYLHDFIARYVNLCNPDKVTVYSDTEEDIRKTRESAIRNHEEKKLAIKGHTIHFDGYYDQARDKKNTKFLLPPGKDLGPEINSIDRDRGLKEIHEIMKDIMRGHELHIKFFCLGPVNSIFSIPCVQLTDSAYVAHSEDLLYRQGYQEFIRQGENARFFKFVHSQGELEEAGLGLFVSKNIDKRRIYIDLEEETVYSANTQYGGNTIGLKKLAMRLGINRGSQEKWLTEHMLIMGVHGPKGRVSYFTGAFPSMCGKTSTAMVEGETIVGDDIAYLRNIKGKTRAVNVESGIFGIIEGINPSDDPIQWKAITSPNEIIFTLPNSESLQSVKDIVKGDFPNLDIKVQAEEGSFPRIILTLKQDQIDFIHKNAVNQSLEIIRNRIDQFGVSEPVIVRQGEDEIIVQLPGVKDPDRALSLIGQTAQLEFKIVDDEGTATLPALIAQAEKNGLWHEGEGREKLNQVLAHSLPPDTQIYFEKEVDPQTKVEKRKPLLLKNQVLMTGDMVKDAQVRIGGSFNEPYVSLDLTGRGAKVFGQITEKYVNHRLAIVLDGVVRSAPVIREKILGGSAQISGSFTYEEASDLAIILRVGALPAPVSIVQNLTVGASLGQDSIDKGISSGLLGAAMVLIFMVVYYRMSGVIANLALILNIFFLFAGLAALQATLTLPGIAGIILSIGMAVDSNVLIFERMREEFAIGKSVKSGVEGGYDMAFWTIVDSQVTTLITALALFLFGTGPIKGFAVTLSLGVTFNLFTTLFATRLAYEGLYNMKMLKPLKFLQFAGKTKINFMGVRKIAFALSGALVLLGLVAFVQLLRGHGNIGVDFSGGTILQYKADKPFELVTVRDIFRKNDMEGIDLQPVTNENRLIVKMKKSTRVVEDNSNQITEILNTSLPEHHFVLESKSEIGSSVSEMLRDKALQAIAISLLGVIIYLALRFDFRFGVAAAIATFHDVVVVLGICWIMNLEINLLIITARAAPSGVSTLPLHTCTRGSSPTRFSSVSALREAFSISTVLVRAWGLDRERGVEGPTLAGLLLLGSENAIRDRLDAFHLDYRELAEPGAVRWVDRVWPDGTWNANLLGFYQRVLEKLHDRLPVPFRLGPDLFRRDETPVHEALREALVNALIHADYTTGNGIRVFREPGRFRFINPGALLLPLDQIRAGGESACRNRTLQHLFVLIGAGERAGSGFPAILSAWREQHWRLPALREDVEKEETSLHLSMESLLPSGTLETLQERFPRRFTELDEAGRSVLALALLEGSVDHARLSEAVGIHSRDLTLLLQTLQRRGLLERLGRGKGCAYQLPEPRRPRGGGSSEQHIPSSEHSATSSEHSGASSEHYEHDSEHSSASSEHSEDAPLSPNSLRKLPAVQALAGRKRVSKPEMEAAILAVCAGRFVTLPIIAGVVQRSPDSVRNHYLRPLLAEGRMELRYPGATNDPRQAYRTVSTGEEQP